MPLTVYYYVSAALELFAALITLVILLVRPLIKGQRSAVDAFLTALLLTHTLAELTAASIVPADEPSSPSVMSPRSL